MKKYLLLCVRVIDKINGILWNNKITKDTKNRIFDTIMRRIMTNGSEYCVINRRDERRIIATEMEYWRRGCNRKTSRDIIRKNVSEERCIYLQ